MDCGFDVAEACSVRRVLRAPAHYPIPTTHYPLPSGVVMLSTGPSHDLRLGFHRDTITCSNGRQDRGEEHGQVRRARPAGQQADCHKE